MPLEGMQAVVKAIDKQVDKKNKALRALYLQTMNTIKTETPVDEGFARAGWHFTINKPSVKKANRRSSNDSRERMPKNVLDKTMYYTNNSAYINILEYGGFKKSSDKVTSGAGGFYSRLRPYGWTRKAVANLQKEIKKL